MHVHQVFGQSHLRVELLAADVAHSDLWIASLFVLLSHLSPLSRHLGSLRNAGFCMNTGGDTEAGVGGGPAHR
jgi:hypothetical protein